MPTASGFTLQTFATLILGTGLLSGLVSWLATYVVNYGTQKKGVAYLAVRLAVALESFAIECAEVISDNQMSEAASSSGEFRVKNIPNLAPFPNDSEWKYLSPELAARLLTFPNDIQLSIMSIRGQCENVYPPDACSETSLIYNKQVGKCGYRAWLIAKDLRSENDIPAFHPRQISWDFTTLLKAEHDIAMKEIKQMNEEAEV